MLWPKLPENMRDEMLEEAVNVALDENTDVEGCRFYGEEMPDTAGKTLEFSGCLFEKCVIRPSSGRLVFVDCVLDTCDLSGADFIKCTFQRIAFRHCRMTGARFSETPLMNVSFSECQMNLASFADVKAQHVLMENCVLKESSFFRFKWMDWVLRSCQMQQAEMQETPLKNLDVTSCRVDGLLVALNALRGMKVTPEQAVQLSVLLGLTIVE